MPFQLPQGFEVQLPDIQDLAGRSICSPETGFAPDPTLPRVTDQQREIDARTFREIQNAAANLTDGINTAKAWVDSAIAGTKLGRSLVRYQTGLQDIRTEKVKYAQAVVKTEIEQGSLRELQLKANYQDQALPELTREYEAGMTLLRARADRAAMMAQAYTHETAQRFPELSAGDPANVTQVA